MNPWPPWGLRQYGINESCDPSFPTQTIRKSHRLAPGGSPSAPCPSTPHPALCPHPHPGIFFACSLGLGTGDIRVNRTPALLAPTILRKRPHKVLKMQTPRFKLGFPRPPLSDFLCPIPCPHVSWFKLLPHQVTPIGTILYPRDTLQT